MGANATGMNTVKNGHFFFLFRKTTRISKYNKRLAVDDKGITDQTHILEHIRKFYETSKQKTVTEMENFFSDVDIPKLSENQENFLRKI